MLTDLKSRRCYKEAQTCKLFNITFILSDFFCYELFYTKTFCMFNLCDVFVLCVSELVVSKLCNDINCGNQIILHDLIGHIFCFHPENGDNNFRL